MTLETLRATASAMEARYQRDEGARALLQTQRDDAARAINQAQGEIAIWEQVQVLFQKASEYARAQLTARIEAIVTNALQAVFGQPLEFRVVLRTLNNQPAAEWQVVSRYGDVAIEADPQDARGGGVVDVISLALRLAVLELHEPRLDGPLVLDEPGKHVSEEYAPNLAVFLRQYAARTGRQIVVITHNPRLAEVADRSFRVSQRVGVSEVIQVG